MELFENAGGGQEWFDRVQAEANIASEFALKVTGARSIPDATTAYRGWIGRRFEMMTEDRKHLVDKPQKLVQVDAHFFQTLQS